MGLPIPGFDFTAEASTEGEEVVPDATEQSMDKPPGDNVVSRTQTETRPAMASVRNMEISIIIQEGAAPELIENIRQVVMVASRFNRPRGDVLSIMTASFKERRDEKSAEQVLLKNIAEKLESLESQRERLGEVDWKQELENYKESEAERRQEDRLYFQSKLAEFETAARDQSYDQERQAMLRQDSVRLQALNEEIQNLKSFLGTANLSDSSAAEAQSSVQSKLSEKESLDAQIAEKLAMLDKVQSDLDSQPSGGGNGMLIFVAVLSALVIVLIVVLVFVLMNKPKEPAMPPWMMYPPRRPKKKGESEGIAPQQPQASPGPAVQPTATPTTVEDVGVLQSEVEGVANLPGSLNRELPEPLAVLFHHRPQDEAQHDRRGVVAKPHENIADQPEHQRHDNVEDIVGDTVRPDADEEDHHRIQNPSRHGDDADQNADQRQIKDQKHQVADPEADDQPPEHLGFA